MKKLKLFFIAFFWFAFMGGFELLKGLANDGVLSSVVFMAIVASALIVMWCGAGLAIRAVKRKGLLTEFVLGFLYLLILVSLFASFDMIRYFLENDMLNVWYFFAVGFVLVFVGWAGGKLDSWLPKKHNKKIKRI